MQREIVLSCLALTVLVVLAVSSPTVDAAPYTHQSYWDQLEQEDPETLGDMFTRLERALMLENNKRGLDLGLSRGFSGSQAAKHLMGLAAANYAGGPGRRRRSEQA